MSDQMKRAVTTILEAGFQVEIDAFRLLSDMEGKRDALNLLVERLLNVAVAMEPRPISINRDLVVKAAIDEAVPVHVLSSALFERFASRGEAEFADKLLSAMRYQFGGHVEKTAEKS